MKLDKNTLLKALYTGGGAAAGIAYGTPYIAEFPVLSYELGALKVATIAAGAVSVLIVNYVLEMIS